MTYFPIKLQLRIDWSEMDLFGHVNNVAFFKYIQSSRVNYWEQTGLTKFFEENRLGPILASSACQFKKPLFYPDNITIEARVEFMKNTSFGIHHQIIDGHNEIAAEAHDVIVMFDFNKNEKIPIPEEFRKGIEKIENIKY